MWYLNICPSQFSRIVWLTLGIVHGEWMKSDHQDHLTSPWWIRVFTFYSINLCVCMRVSSMNWTTDFYTLVMVSLSKVRQKLKNTFVFKAVLIYFRASTIGQMYAVCGCVCTFCVDISTYNSDWKWTKYILTCQNFTRFVTTSNSQCLEKFAD